MFRSCCGAGASVIGVSLLIAGPLHCAMAQEAADNEQLRKARHTVMEKAAQGFKVEQSSTRPPPTFGNKPLLRYSDPTRVVPGAHSLLDATVWRLGDKGRPLGLLTLEIYGKTPETAILSYEFASLADGELALAHGEQKELAWQFPAGGLTMRPLPGAGQPGDSPAARLGQMRQFTRRFKVSESYQGVTVECRLLAQPIDRYQSEDGTIVDGALFAFANGTNPEIGLLIEASKAGWTYGLGRLCAAECKIELDGKEVGSFAAGDFRNVKQGHYLNYNHPIPGPK
jgi:hypothetical protein